MKDNNTTNSYNTIKKNNMRNMLFSLKILCLFFAVTPLFQHFSKFYHTDVGFSYINMIFLTCITLVLLGVIMLLWAGLDESLKYHNLTVLLEVVLLFLLLTFSIYYTNGSSSRYKSLYLMIIVTYTIELGKKTGILLSAASGVLILVADIIVSDSSLYFDSDLTLATLFIVIAWTLGYYVKLEHTHINYLTNIANIDGLTGIYNHRYFHEYLEDQFDGQKRDPQSLSLILIDVDFFKTYNDLFGHRKGDELLTSLVALFSNTIRSTDLLFRYGGDEFCVLLHDTTEAEAVTIGEQLRQTVSSTYFQGMEHLPNKKLTISLGVAAVSPEIDDHLTLIDKADSALYRAKYLRKNRVEAYGSIWDAFKDTENPNVEDILKYVKTLISVIDAKDKYTYFHIERVAHYCSLFADYMQFDKDTKQLLIYSAYLHDLGKINISKSILISDQKLTLSEWNELKTHPSESASIIEKLDGFEQVVPIVKHHHERYDGSGYPDNLACTDIPELSRLLSVIDSFDAMTNKRPYQKTKTQEEGLEELLACKGSQFDPYYVDHFVAMMRNTVE